MITNKGDITKGAPEGMNILRKELLKLENPNIITPNHILKAIPNVINK